MFFHALVFLLLVKTVAWVVEGRGPGPEVDVHFLQRPLRDLAAERPGPPAPMPAPEPAPVGEPQPSEPAQPPEQSLGVGELAELFSLRRGVGHLQGVREGGGSAGSENAVAAGLRWLAAHQDQDGYWDPKGFTRHCPPDDVCSGAAPGRVFEWPFDLGVSGLALLAFLGAGHTPQEGEHAEVVARAVDALLRAQQPSGGFSNEPAVVTRLADGRVVRGRRISTYCQGICTLALAECLAMTGEERLRQPVQKAVDFLVGCQQEEGGWDYFQFDTGRNDSSVTGWVVMALKSAGAAGVEVPPECWYRTFGFIQSMSHPQGYLQYANTQRRYGVALAAVGLLCREYLGWPRDSDDLARTAELLLQHPPDWDKLADYPELHSMYYWYYATLALHHLGGSYWERWNQQMRDMLIAHQETQGHRSGSWPPDGLWARQHAGRIYSTALCVLNLEIYYRYLPLYQVGPDRDLLAVLRLGYGRETDPSRRRQLIENLGPFLTDEATALLRTALQDDAEAVRFEAARQLVHRGDVGGVAVLSQVLESADSFRRGQAVELLGRLRRREAVGALIEALADDQEFIVELALAHLRNLTGEVVTVDPGADREHRRAVADGLRQRWQAGELGVRSRELVHLARVVAVRRDPDYGDEVIARALPGEPSPEWEGLISGQELLILRAGVEIGRLRVERLFTDMFAGRVLPGYTAAVREGDQVFAPERVGRPAGEPVARGGGTEGADEQRPGQP